MTTKYDRRESWEKEHDGAPIKCILDVSKNIHYYLNQTMAANGLTCTQSRILGYLRQAENEGRCVFQREIETVFRIKRSSVTSVLQTLEKKGFLYREIDPADARVKRLILTDSAREMQLKTYQMLCRMEKEIRSLFTQEEFCQYLEYMSRIDNKAKELHCAGEDT